MTTVAEIVLREAMVPGCAVCLRRHSAMVIADGDFARAAHRRATAKTLGAIWRFDALLASSRTEREWSRLALADHLRAEHDVSLDVTT